MRNCSVSAPVQCCNAADIIVPNLRFVAVQLLTKQVLYFIVEPKVRTKELLQKTCQHLSSQGMLGTELFGLATDFDGEYLFVDPEYKINKYAPKNWRASSTHGLDSAGRPLLTFYFRVNFYIENPFILQDEISLHHYYLQLRQNLLSRGCFVDLSFKEELLYLLVGLALQADLGDFSETQHTGPYFPVHEYFPPQMLSVKAESKIIQSAANLHRANRSLSRNKAETQFIREASCNDFSPLSHNSHLYHLKQRKNEPHPGSVWLTICQEGIEIYDRNKHTNCVTGKFKWNDIGRLTFDRKKFEVRAVNRRSNDKLTYYCSSDEKSKHLLLLCRATHQFSLTLQSKLNQLLRSSNAQDCPRWTADGCYSSNLVDQRISVISTTSSNTTSGIVSDKVLSHDESEDELEEIEIMITHPPAPSVESLALAHLRDDSLSLAVNEEPRDENVDCNISKKSLIIGVADGSQCSSSCSTVVQQPNTAPTTPEKLKLPTPSKRTQVREQNSASTTQLHTTSQTEPRRCASTTSSLELGYSHTAQNSAVSDNASTCVELDYGTQSPLFSSGVYTLHSSAAEENTVVGESTIAASSETSGIFTGTTGTQESEGQHSRRGSIVSASGSFHGDGSDPSDAGRGNLLSAEELSDLIVGRKPSLVTHESPTTPRRGVYPSRATVSSTLDSDSDYVTLPPPPIPPPRTDSVKKSTKEFVSRVDNLLMDDCSMLGSLTNRSFTGKTSMQEEQLLRANLVYNQPPLLAPKHALLSKSTSSLNSCNSAKSSLSPPFVLSPEHQYYTLSNYQLSPRTYGSYASAIPEEANARFMTTKPRINIFTVHTAQQNANPSYTTSNTYNSNKYPQSAAPVRSLITEARQTMHMDPASRMKIEHSNPIPIVGSNNYLDFRSSAAAYMSHLHQGYLPPPSVHRQPPPPPPPPMSPMYANSQVERFRQQLYSDGDYVYYPWQDPAVSKQEYMDAKMAIKYPPPPYHSFKQSRLLYRSTPNVAIASGCIPLSYSSSQGSKYASNQNLNDSATYTSGSSASFLSSSFVSSPQQFSPVSYLNSFQNLRYADPMKVAQPTKCMSVSRTRSDDNILNTVYEREVYPAPVSRARRPPPPPPYDLHALLLKENKRLEETSSQSYPPVPSHLYLNPSPHQTPSSSKPQPQQSHKKYNYEPSVISPKSLLNSKISEVEILKQNSNVKDCMLDIRSLREKSRNLDLPLISALCNDRSLIKQTNVPVLAKAVDNQTETTSPTNTNFVGAVPVMTNTLKKRLFASFLSSGSSKNTSCLASSKKYPVSSGANTDQSLKSNKKSNHSKLLNHSISDTAMGSDDKLS